MKVIYVTGTQKKLQRNSCIAIGIFDGMHRGHQYLIRHMIDCARQLKATPVVITFFPHPAHVLRPDVKLPYLSSLLQRLAMFKAMGVEICVVINFNKKFAAIDPVKFISETLVKQLRVKAIFVGEGFRFGKERSGDIDLFKRLAHDGVYDMHPMKALKQGGEAISSTRIRRLVAEGNLKAAAQLLGRNFSLEGEVVAGAKRGKRLGFPTANVRPSANVLPANGVYAVRVRLGKMTYAGVANIGLRPSFNDKNPQVHVEVHIFDFNRNIYGRAIAVEFLKKIREEKKFSSIEALKIQITKDITQARQIIS